MEENLLLCKMIKQEGLRSSCNKEYPFSNKSKERMVINMGILTMIRSIKQIHKEDLTILKIGKFYYCYGKDAYIISYFFDYKLNLVENIYSCGFPSQSLNKIISKLENNKINYIIIDRRNNYDIEEKENYKNLNNYNKYYEKAKEIVGLKVRIQKINEYLLENMNKRKIYEIEKILKNDK